MSLHHYENEVLTLAGVGTEFDTVRKITEHIGEIIGWFEHFLCLTILDPSEADKAYREKRFAFQQGGES